MMVLKLISERQHIFVMTHIHTVHCTQHILRLRQMFQCVKNNNYYSDFCTHSFRYHSFAVMYIGYGEHVNVSTLNI